MSYEVYKLLHLLSLFTLTVSLGSLLTYASLKSTLGTGTPSTKWVIIRKWIMILHGISSLILLITGFGLIAKLNLHNFPPWVIGELLFWIVLCIAVPFFVRKTMRLSFLWILVCVTGVLAMHFAIYKPFS